MAPAKCEPCVFSFTWPWQSSTDSSTLLSLVQLEYKHWEYSYKNLVFPKLLDKDSTTLCTCVIFSPSPSRQNSIEPWVAWIYPGMTLCWTFLPSLLCLLQPVQEHMFKTSLSLNATSSAGHVSRSPRSVKNNLQFHVHRQCTNFDSSHHFKNNLIIKVSLQP